MMFGNAAKRTREPKESSWLDKLLIQAEPYLHLFEQQCDLVVNISDISTHHRLVYCLLHNNLTDKDTITDIN